MPQVENTWLMVGADMGDGKKTVLGSKDVLQFTLEPLDDFMRDLRGDDTIVARGGGVRRFRLEAIISTFVQHMGEDFDALIGSVREQVCIGLRTYPTYNPGNASASYQGNIPADYARRHVPGDVQRALDRQAQMYDEMVDAEVEDDYEFDATDLLPSVDSLPSLDDLTNPNAPF